MTSETPCCRFTWHPEHPQGSCQPKPAEPPACGKCGKPRYGTPPSAKLCLECLEAEPQSAPPIDFGIADTHAAKILDGKSWLHHPDNPCLAHAYLALKAERDILKLALAEESGYLKRASAERDALKVECDELAANVCDYSELNTALKARVEELEGTLRSPRQGA